MSTMSRTTKSDLDHTVETSINPYTEATFRVLSLGGGTYIFEKIKESETQYLHNQVKLAEKQGASSMMSYLEGFAHGLNENGDDNEE